VDTLIAALQRLLPEASRRTLKQLLAQRRVVVGQGVVTRADAELPPGARVRILPRRHTAAARAAGGGAPRGGGVLATAWADDHLIVVDKPPGLLSVSPRAESRESAWSLLRSSLRERGERPGVHLVHRLDRAASGLLVFARSGPVRGVLKERFKRHDVERRYAAVVAGRVQPAVGELRDLLVGMKEPGQPVRPLRPDDPPRLRAEAKEAVTRYRVLGEAGNATALDVRLETGRKHQIRAQLAAAGHPLLGDRLYDGPKAARLFLHAAVLGLAHPVTGRPLRIVSPPGRVFDRRVPGAFRNVFDRPWSSDSATMRPGKRTGRSG
jgi:23S rRNA pseudouridine1911/1915/1917 synthase